jgi:co-chaperonin GroES (HSP10)
MKLTALGKKVIVELININDDSGFVITNSREEYNKGKVISSGDLIVGKTVIFPSSCAIPIGMGFPDNYVILDISDIHAYVEECEVG